MADEICEIDLLDINVWLALADENHAHHVRARCYWEDESANRIAFTRVTMLGFVRLLTNRVAMHGFPFTAPQAWDAYRKFRALPEVVWIGDQNEGALDADAYLEGWMSNSIGFSTLNWTDAHLASIAVVYRCRLVSFDGGYRGYSSLTFLHLKSEM